MPKSKKIQARNSNVRWPSEEALKVIRERLSSEEIEGSRVLGPNAPLAERIKQNLCSKIVEYRAKHQITQKQLAEKLGVDEPEMSRILHYQIDRYSIDRLIGYLEILYPKVSFEVSAA
ncbi:XRE family transcriptional regulator [Bdellovibrionota bacterium FG-1]